MEWLYDVWPELTGWQKLKIYLMVRYFALQRDLRGLFGLA
jgi:hypothetical protein